MAIQTPIVAEFDLSTDQVAFLVAVIPEPTDSEIDEMFVQHEEEVEGMLRYALLAA